MQPKLMRSGYPAMIVLGMGLMASFLSYPVITISDHRNVIWAVTIALASVMAWWAWRQLFGKDFSPRDASLGHFSFVLLLSFIPAFYSVSPLLVLINGVFDSTPAHPVVARVLDKYKPSRHPPILELSSWRRLDTVEKVDVEGEIFAAVEKGALVTLQTHNGALGWEWVSEVKELRQHRD